MLRIDINFIKYYLNCTYKNRSKIKESAEIDEL